MKSHEIPHRPGRVMRGVFGVLTSLVTIKSGIAPVGAEVAQRPPAAVAEIKQQSPFADTSLETLSYVRSSARRHKLEKVVTDVGNELLARVERGEVDFVEFAPSEVGGNIGFLNIDVPQVPDFNQPPSVAGYSLGVRKQGNTYEVLSDSQAYPHEWGVTVVRGSISIGKGIGPTASIGKRDIAWGNSWNDTTGMVITTEFGDATVRGLASDITSSGVVRGEMPIFGDDEGSYGGPPPLVVGVSMGFDAQNVDKTVAHLLAGPLGVSSDYSLSRTG